MNQSGGATWPTDPTAYERSVLIGQGASAKVYIAKLADGRRCALKILDLEALVHDDVLDEIRKELQAMALCRHPNVISHYVSFPYKRHMYLVMPLMEHGSCSDLMRSHFHRGFGNAPGLIAHILESTLKALEYLHDPKQAQIHRDLKAANLLLAKDGTVCLADFGVAACLKEQRTRHTFVGTPCWMAPEVLAQNSKGYNSKADIWSLGILALELCNGEAPYQRLHHMKIMQNILDKAPPTAPETAPADFAKFVAVCLQKNPEKRPDAKTLLQHPFLKRSDPAALQKVLKNLPPLEQRKKPGGPGAALGMSQEKSGDLKPAAADDTWDFDLPEGEDEPVKPKPVETMDCDLPDAET